MQSFALTGDGERRRNEQNDASAIKSRGKEAEEESPHEGDAVGAHREQLDLNRRPAGVETSQDGRKEEADTLHRYICRQICRSIRQCVNYVRVVDGTHIQRRRARSGARGKLAL